MEIIKKIKIGKNIYSGSGGGDGRMCCTSFLELHYLFDEEIMRLTNLPSEVKTKKMSNHDYERNLILPFSVIKTREALVKAGYKGNLYALFPVVSYDWGFAHTIGDSGLGSFLANLPEGENSFSSGSSEEAKLLKAISLPLLPFPTKIRCQKKHQGSFKDESLCFSTVMEGEILPDTWVTLFMRRYHQTGWKISPDAKSLFRGEDLECFLAELEDFRQKKEWGKNNEDLIEGAIKRGLGVSL